MTAVIIIEAVVILLLLILVAGLLRSHAEILRTLDRLGAGDAAANVEGPRPRTVGFEEAPMKTLVGQTPNGTTRTIGLDSGRNPTLLAFLSSGCASCHTFWSEITSQPRLPLENTRILVITKGSDQESPRSIDDLSSPETEVLMSSDIWDTFKVPLTPYFMLLDPEGKTVGEGSALTWEQLNGLLSKSIADSQDPKSLRTSARADFTDSRLAQSGVEPGDSSLYEDPLER